VCGDKSFTPNPFALAHPAPQYLCACPPCPPIPLRLPTLPTNPFALAHPWSQPPSASGPLCFGTFCMSNGSHSNRVTVGNPDRAMLTWLHPGHRPSVLGQLLLQAIQDEETYLGYHAWRKSGYRDTFNAYLGTQVPHSLWFRNPFRPSQDLDCLSVCLSRDVMFFEL
jgi:hypothetical protein